MYQVLYCGVSQISAGSRDRGMRLDERQSLRTHHLEKLELQLAGGGCLASGCCLGFALVTLALSDLFKPRDRSHSHQNPGLLLPLQWFPSPLDLEVIVDFRDPALELGIEFARNCARSFYSCHPRRGGTKSLTYRRRGYTSVGGWQAAVLKYGLNEVAEGDFTASQATRGAPYPGCLGEQYSEFRQECCYLTMTKPGPRSCAIAKVQRSDTAPKQYLQEVLLVRPSQHGMNLPSSGRIHPSMTRATHMLSSCSRWLRGALEVAPVSFVAHRPPSPAVPLPVTRSCSRETRSALQYTPGWTPDIDFLQEGQRLISSGSLRSLTSRAPRLKRSLDNFHFGTLTAAHPQLAPQDRPSRASCNGTGSCRLPSTGPQAEANLLTSQSQLCSEAVGKEAHHRAAQRGRHPNKHRRSLTQAPCTHHPDNSAALLSSW
ncbi:polypeptide N-acetylgalactosaminyltransferase 15 [Lates japonicus]|uniref:Polypeptide N-acetylgalactosaminyltransferase 15 n=1 Tax=Lates japonicus TaxID=270547 RepID=A0AAD3RLP4_LATJO|nr:polypeptide N-acetylgalactosaminyltransferase 15 [Lates japonicus]